MSKLLREIRRTDYLHMCFSVQSSSGGCINIIFYPFLYVLKSVLSKMVCKQVAQLLKWFEKSHSADDTHN